MGAACSGGDKKSRGKQPTGKLSTNQKTVEIGVKKTVVVEQAAPAGKVCGDLLALGRKTVEGEFELEAVDLFDLYEGEGLPEGTKSLAFSLSYGSTTRTLTDDEVNKAFGTLVDLIEKDTPYRVRR